MYKLEDYIIAARSIQVIETAYETNMLIEYTSDSSYFATQQNLLYSGYLGMDDSNFYVEIQKTLERIFEFIFPGSILDRYISVRKNIQNNNYSYLNQIPIFILNICEYGLKLPLYIGHEYVYFVSPFGNEMIKNDAKNYYIYPLFRTNILIKLSKNTNLNNDRTSIETLDFPLVYKYSKDEDFSERLKKTLLDICGFPIQKQIELITNISDGRSYYDQEIISTESEVYDTIMKRYEVEAVADSDYDTLITPTDYLPIIIKKSISNNYAYLTINEASNRKSTFDTVDINLIDSNKSINKISSPDDSKVLLRSHIDSRQICYLTDGIYMVPNNKLAIYDNNDVFLGSINIDMYYNSDKNNNQHYLPGTESLISDMVSSLKIGGIKLTQSIKEIVGILMKFPIKVSKIIFKDIKYFFKKFDKELEKSDSLEYREKVLNDELDHITDMFRGWSRVIIFSTITFALTGQLLFLFLGLIYWKIDDSNTRVRAINRQIKSFNDAILRIDQKIDFAKQEGRYEEVDSLLKEKQMLTLGRRELLQLKKRNYAKADAKNKKKYGDYDTMNNAEKSQTNNYYDY